MKQQTKIAFSVGTAFALALTAGASFIPIPFTNAPVVQTSVETVKGKAPSLLPRGKDWKLVWHDEFDQKTVDRSKWLCRESFWGYDFPAFSHDYEGVEMTGETAKLRLLKKGDDYTSPHLQTGSLTYDVPKEDLKGFWPFGRRVRPTFMHRYGYYEIRCKLNKFNDWHSAFWLQAPGVGSHPDNAYAGTEMDIMESWKLIAEHDAKKRGVSRGNLVGGTCAGGYGRDANGHGHFEWPFVETEDGWHVFGLDWTPWGYDYYCDGKKVGEQNWPVSQVSQFILVSTEPGGYRRIGNDAGLSANRGSREWGKPYENLRYAAAANDCFEVDYVRVYDNAAGYESGRPEPLPIVDVPPVEGDPATEQRKLFIAINSLTTLPPEQLAARVTEADVIRLNSTAEAMKKLKLPGDAYGQLKGLQVSCAKMAAVLRAHPRPPERKTSFAREAVQPFVDAGRTHGMVTVLVNGSQTETDCIGWADVGKRRPITLDDPYMICSQTKGVCGVAAAILIDEGKLKLDDRVDAYIPELKPWKYHVKVGWTNGVLQTRPCGAVITLRHLLTHTAGLAFESPVKGRHGWPSVPLRVHAAMAGAIAFEREPGKRFGYSNWGIDLAARVVEVASGMRFEDFLQERLFRPLGMTATTFNPTDEMLRRAIQLYEVKMEGPCQWRRDIYAMPCPHNGPDVFPSAGAGLWSTARDFSKFYLMLMNRGVGANGVRILSERTCREILEKKQTPEGVADEYSLGFSLQGGGWYGHGGAWGTDALVNPDKRMMKFMVQQIHGEKPKNVCWPWASAFYGAADRFMRQKADPKAKHDFVGRVEDAGLR